MFNSRNWLKREINVKLLNVKGQDRNARAEGQTPGILRGALQRDGILLRKRWVAHYPSSFFVDCSLIRHFTSFSTSFHVIARQEMYKSPAAKLPIGRISLSIWNSCNVLFFIVFLFFFFWLLISIVALVSIISRQAIKLLHAHVNTWMMKPR